MSDGKNIVSYVRCSTQIQAEDGASIEIQHRKIDEFCKDKGYALSKTYEDKGFSGAIKDRPGLVQLIRDCEAGKISRVVIYKYDRLARELSISIWIQSVFKRYGVEVSAVADPEFMSDDPITNALRNFLFVFADMERSIIISRLRSGRDNNAKNGRRGSGPIPYGYLKVGDELQIEPNEAGHVRKIFRWFIKNWTLTEIANVLNKRGAVTKRGKSFSIQAVKNILSNGIYCGDMSFGSISSKGIHEPIVSRRLFLKAQKGSGEEKQR